MHPTPAAALEGPEPTPLRLRRWLAGLLLPALLLPLLLLGAPAARAYDNPELLPDHPTPVIDLAKALTDQQRSNLEQQLEAFEQSSGWKLRVLTQYERTPGLAIRDFWDLDERSLLLVADPRGGNLLNFNVGEALFALMPRTFWVELQTRYGNQYYVRDHGEDGAIVDALTAVEGCLERGGCQVVPGLPREQWLLTLSTSILGGVIAGIAGYPRQEGRKVEWAWVLLLSPLWLILFGALGLGPVVTRTSDWLPVARNTLGFLGAAAVAYQIAGATVGRQKFSGGSEGGSGE
ncbi:MAG: TPM domain-containing protein [Synechococcus sp.]|nr:TPM domain-containing protein [Synechococcus sp.]